jgi:phi LC3 family holin
MKINLQVRLKNPVFWVNVLGTILLTALSYLSLTAQDLTTWGSVKDLIVNIFTNPYLLGLCIWNIWNAVYDPTTKGVSDSENALSYTEPKE